MAFIIIKVVFFLGLPTYLNRECPVGHFCEESSEPEICPAGQMRELPGATAASDCPLCRPGYYCPNDTANIKGNLIILRSGYSWIVQGSLHFIRIP